MTHSSPNLRNRRLEGVWEVLGATLAPKVFQNLSLPILVDFGRAWIVENLARMGQDGAKLDAQTRNKSTKHGCGNDLSLKASWNHFVHISFDFRGQEGGTLARTSKQNSLLC